MAHLEHIPAHRPERLPHTGLQKPCQGLQQLPDTYSQRGATAQDWQSISLGQLFTQNRRYLFPQGDFPLQKRLFDIRRKIRQHIGGVLRRCRDNPAAAAPLLDRKGKRYYMAAQLPQLGKHLSAVRTRQIDFIEKYQHRGVRLQKRLVQHLHLGVDPIRGGYDQHRRIQDRQAALNLPQKVGVAGGIDEYKPRSLKGKSRPGSLHRNTPATFNFQRVRLGSPGVHTAGLAQHAADS